MPLRCDCSQCVRAIQFCIGCGCWPNWIKQTWPAGVLNSQQKFREVFNYEVFNTRHAPRLCLVLLRLERVTPELIERVIWGHNLTLLDRASQLVYCIWNGVPQKNKNAQFLNVNVEWDWNYVRALLWYHGTAGTCLERSSSILFFLHSFDAIVSDLNICNSTLCFIYLIDGKHGRSIHERL